MKSARKGTPQQKPPWSLVKLANSMLLQTVKDIMCSKAQPNQTFLLYQHFTRLLIIPIMSIMCIRPIMLRLLIIPTMSIMCIWPIMLVMVKAGP